MQERWPLKRTVRLPLDCILVKQVGSRYPTGMHSFLVSVPAITRYVSETGADTDGCGETVETPCRTMHPVFAQLLAQPLLIPLNLSRRVAEVWNKSINYAADLETQAHEENYDNSTHNHRKISYTMVGGISIVLSFD